MFHNFDSIKKSGTYLIALRFYAMSRDKLLNLITRWYDRIPKNSKSFVFEDEKNSKRLEKDSDGVGYRHSTCIGR